MKMVNAVEIWTAENNIFIYIFMWKESIDVKHYAESEAKAPPLLKIHEYYFYLYFNYDAFSLTQTIRSRIEVW
jgi:hypothetical protein